MARRKSPFDNILPPKIGPSAGVLLYLLLVTACQPSGTRINPQAPKAAYSRTTMEVRNEQFLSTVNVPVSISIADIERQINNQVSGLVFEDNQLDGSSQQGSGSTPYWMKVWKRGNIAVRAGVAGTQDSLFHFTVPLRIWAKAGIKVLGFTRYQETEFELNMRFATRFSIDPDWTVTTRTQADGYEWVKRPSTSIAGFAIPITSIVGRLIDQNLGTMSQALDQQVHKNVDLQTPVLKAWNTVREPYLLSEKYRTWLMVVPRRILITPFRFEGNQIRATIGMEGHTLTTTGSKPDVRPAVTLPNLVVVKQIPDNFQIGILSEATYEEAAKIAAGEFVGKTFSFSNDKYTIAISDIDLYGQNDNLIIKAGLTGSITGNIYLRGKPYYDAQTKTVSLKDLTYDLDTRSLLQRAANWLLQGTFARMMEKQFTIPVGGQIDEVRNAVQARLRNNQLTKGVIMSGNIEDIRPDQVYLTPTALLAVVYAQGRVSVKVDGLQ
ncbi:hypothetical protein GCM10023187_09060 [Nibrella viscosa]|uniref:DUF4403 family protein n=1 Tax=Nibrella viscosa TaxID=1084524 RepID=A0ABP8JZI9_9BACT